MRKTCWYIVGLVYNDDNWPSDIVELFSEEVKYASRFLTARNEDEEIRHPHCPIVRAGITRRRDTLKKIVVAGINDLSTNITNLIDPQRSEVTGFLTNTAPSVDSVKPDSVVTHQELPNLRYDYLIATDGETQLPSDKSIINLDNFVSNHYNFEIYRALASLQTIDQSIRCFVTGLSYAEVGIDVNELPFSSINLAASSQDLFYDFQLAKYMFSTSEFASNIRYALIGLAYYSFQYDLSKSSVGSRSLMYYPFLRTLHHFQADRNLDELRKFEEQIAGIFRRDYLTELFNVLRKRDESWWPRMVNGRLNERKIEEAKEQAEEDSKKDYPLTVQENIRILTDYIEVLKIRDIEPILVVCPTRKYYNEFLSSRIKNEFHQITHYICETYDVHLIDYFDSGLFGDDDFYDPTHLSMHGAKRFTKMLRDQL